MTLLSEFPGNCAVMSQAPCCFANLSCRIFCSDVEGEVSWTTWNASVNFRFRGMYSGMVQLTQGDLGALIAGPFAFNGYCSEQCTKQSCMSQPTHSAFLLLTAVTAPATARLLASRDRTWEMPDDQQTAPVPTNSPPRSSNRQCPALDCDTPEDEWVLDTE
jgi:hypothetical protein